MLCVVLEKHTAPLRKDADAAHAARSKNNATNWSEEEDRVYWFEPGIDSNAKRCLCRAHCPALYCVLVDVTFWTAVRAIFARGGGHGDRQRTINRMKQKDEHTKHAHKPGICIIPGTTSATSNCCRTFKRAHSAARHSTAKRRARHDTAPCCAALLSCI